MCNACGFLCCASDVDDQCGCDHPDHPDCPERCDECNDYLDWCRCDDEWDEEDADGVA